MLDVNPTNIDDFFKSVLNANGFVMLSGNPAVVSLPSKLPSQMVSDSDDSDNQSYDTFLLSHLTSQYLALRSEILS